MPWWLWLMFGIAFGAVGLVVVIHALNWIDYRVHAKRRAARGAQSAAEQQMQRLVQSTIQDMFKATRGIQ